MFRDAAETMDMSLYFYLGGDSAKINLKKWYKDEVVPHRIFRKFIRDHESEDKAKDLGILYQDLSKYTHRTYQAITKSYIMGRENKIAYDGFAEEDTRVLPHVTSLSYAVIAALIKRFVKVSEETGQIEKELVNSIWAVSLEKETVPRRFGSGPGQLIRGDPILMELKLEK